MEPTATALDSVTIDSNNGELTSDSQIVTQKLAQQVTQLMTTPILTQLVTEGRIKRPAAPLANHIVNRVVT